MRWTLTGRALCVAAVCGWGAATGRADTGAVDLAGAAVSADSATARAAIEKLREQGPAGLDQLFTRYADVIERHGQDGKGALVSAMPFDSEWLLVCAAIDGVSEQHNDVTSHLYWYTDWTAAMAAARDTGRPILHLRLLGRLDEELSCANSRFFRTLLYSDPAIHDYLRGHFILYWSSERPVPKVTVDFGDGRAWQTTVTGNSIHYVMDARGRVVDALPGMYGPGAFLKELKGMEEEARAVAGLSEPAKREALAQYHATALRRLADEWKSDLAAAKGVPDLALDQADKFTDEQWAAIAALHGRDVALGRPARAAVQARFVNARAAARLAMTKMVAEAPWVRALRNLGQTLTVDTVRDEYVMHATLHRWLAAGAESGGFEKFNAAVYRDLFLTPREDPNLGLAPTDRFDGLDEPGPVAQR